MGSFTRLGYIIQFKIEFLLPFTSCRKVLGKIPEKGMQKFSGLLGPRVPISQYYRPIICPDYLIDLRST